MEVDVGGRPLVAVNIAQCHRIATLLASREIPEDREDVPVRGAAASRVSNFFFFVVAICHQTSPQGKPPLEGTAGGRHRVGWDYLVAKFEEVVSADSSWLDPTRWQECTSKDIEEIFSDSKFGSRLVGIERRAELIRDLGSGMQRSSWTDADALYAMCEGRIRSGSPNLLGSLGAFDAYRDPVWKKSLFFLALMRNSGQWRYQDPQEMGAPVDYHEMRGHLRLQTVTVLDPRLASKLVGRALLKEREEIAIRRAVFNAIKLISDSSGLKDPSRAHYLFWNIFRAVCVRKQPRCVRNEIPPTLPDRYLSQLNVDTAVHCPYEGICPSAHMPDPILEPIADTDFY